MARKGTYVTINLPMPNEIAAYYAVTQALPGRGGLQSPQPVAEYRLAGVRRGGLP